MRSFLHIERKVIRINFLSDYEEVKVDNFGIDDLKFLELTGRKASRKQGEGVIVAVVDTGVNPHLEFEDRILEGYCTNRAYKTNQWKDDRGHGTHVASSIAGKNVGVAPKAKILPIKVLDASGGCNNPIDIVKGIEYAINWIGPKGEKVNIINLSLGGTKKAFGSAFDRLHSAIKRAVSENITVNCAAGNTGTETDHYPGSFEEPNCISAVDHDKNKALFTTTGKQVDFCQIGVNVIGAHKDGGYVALSGTSMATPLASGIKADIISDYVDKVGEYPLEREVYKIGVLNSKDIGIKGVDKIYGVGFLCLQPLDIDIKLIIGDPHIYINGETIETDSPPIIHNDRFYVPLRWILSYLGGYVKFFEDIRTAIFRL